MEQGGKREKKGKSSPLGKRGMWCDLHFEGGAGHHIWGDCFRGFWGEKFCFLIDSDNVQVRIHNLYPKDSLGNPCAVCR